MKAYCPPLRARTRNRLPALVVTIGLAVGATLPAGAQTPGDILFSPLRAEDVASFLQEQGYRARIESATEDAAPSIRSATQGMDFHIDLGRCDENFEACTVLTFTIGIDLDAPVPERVLNERNTTFWGKHLLDDEGDPWLDLEVNVEGGVTRANFTSTLEWWEEMMADFNEFVEGVGAASGRHHRPADGFQPIRIDLAESSEVR